MIKLYKFIIKKITLGTVLCAELQQIRVEAGRLFWYRRQEMLVSWISIVREEGGGQTWDLFRGRVLWICQWAGCGE